MFKLRVVAGLAMVVVLSACTAFNTNVKPTAPATESGVVASYSPPAPAPTLTWPTSPPSPVLKKYEFPTTVTVDDPSLQAVIDAATVTSAPLTYDFFHQSFGHNWPVETPRLPVLQAMGFTPSFDNLPVYFNRYVKDIKDVSVAGIYYFDVGLIMVTPFGMYSQWCRLQGMAFPLPVPCNKIVKVDYDLSLVEKYAFTSVVEGENTIYLSKLGIYNPNGSKIYVNKYPADKYFVRDEQMRAVRPHEYYKLPYEYLVDFVGENFSLLVLNDRRKERNILSLDWYYLVGQGYPDDILERGAVYPRRSENSMFFMLCGGGLIGYANSENYLTAGDSRLSSTCYS